jgi:PTS system nitrogen regulatory IIA component
MAELVSLSDLLRRGGVYYNIAGANPVEVLSELSRAIVMPTGVEREDLLRAILEREALMPTAIGHGIAIPHPRSPLIRDAGEQRVCVAFLKTPVAYNALDRKPVSTLFLILSAEARLHLGILAEISHLCQKPEFLGFLEGRPSTEELARHVEEIEASWKKTSGA